MPMYFGFAAGGALGSGDCERWRRTTSRIECGFMAAVIWPSSIERSAGDSFAIAASDAEVSASYAAQSEAVTKTACVHVSAVCDIGTTSPHATTFLSAMS